MHRKRFALAMAAILLQKRKIKKKPRIWVHKFFTERKLYGEYFTVFCRFKMNLNQEIYARKFFEYVRMDFVLFEKLLSLLQSK